MFSIDMKANQFRDAAEYFGLEKQAFAALLGVTARHARRYASGDRPVPAPIARLIVLMKRSKLTGQQLAELFEREKV